MIPFDDEELAYIAALDPDADVELLRRELPSLRDSCLRTLEVSTTLLKVIPSILKYHKSLCALLFESHTRLHYGFASHASFDPIDCRGDRNN